MNPIYREEAAEHRPVEEEFSFYKAVCQGDMDAVRRNCEEGVFGKTEGMGILSANSLTNLKYHFVITTAMIARYCIEAGMQTEQAYRLSDYYIFHMDSCTGLDSIVEIHDRMVLDYTGKMAIINRQTHLSRPVILATEYIYSHLSERITVHEIATFVHLSDAYLSRLFAREVGQSVSDYIREKKVERAQNLLKYSPLSCAEISSDLAFSTQSHFIRIFERYVGMTPNRYRAQFSRKLW